MIALTQALILVSSAAAEFGITVDPIEIMHWILLAQDTAAQAL